MDMRTLGGNAVNTVKQAGNKIGGMHMLGNGIVGDAMNVFGAVSVYKDSIEKGDSAGTAVVKAGADFAFGELFFGGMQKALAGKVGTVGQLGIPMLMMMGIQLGSSGFIESSKHTTESMAKAYNHVGLIGSGYFDMNEYGYTMRQRSLNAIQQNGLNTQSVLGNEARNYMLGW